MMANGKSSTLNGSESDHLLHDADLMDPWIIAAAPEDLINDPLEFIFAEHHRQRQAAIMLHLIADGEFNRQGVSDLINFLEGDFAFHAGDEEIGFFPILKQQCRPEDNIEKLIARLIQEHRDDEAIRRETVRFLNDLLSGKKLPPDGERHLRSFAEHIRQHLAVENAVLLPIARVRMDKSALKAMSDILLRRRE